MFVYASIADKSDSKKVGTIFYRSNRSTIFAIMISEEEFGVFIGEVVHRALLASECRTGYVVLLRESPDWKRFGNDEIGYWKNIGYRNDFLEAPGRFREMMRFERVAAYLSENREGWGNIEKLPILSYESEQEKGVFLHFYCIEDIGF